MTILEQGASERDLASWRKYCGRIGEDARSTPIYKVKLNGAVPDRLSFYPRELRSSDGEAGAVILSGVWKIGRDEMKIAADTAPWDRPGPSRHFADRLHRFSWLKDLCAAGPEGQTRARQLISSWTRSFGKWNSFVWRTSVTADRLWNWLLAGPNILEKNPDHDDILESLARQGRHLQLSVDECPDPQIRLKAIFVLIALSFAMEEFSKQLPGLEFQAEELIGAHVLPDGGHISRNPEALLDLLLELQTIDDIYLRTGRPSHPTIARLLPRMASMLKFLRSGDGGLPVMNGGSEGSHGDVENALQPYASARAFVLATKTGIHKLEAGGIRLLLDAGMAPPEDCAMNAHAGCLSIDLEDNGERLITNCGSDADIDPVWRAATRNTDGHSTLVLTGKSACEFIPSRSLGVTVPSGPGGISAKRMEDADEITIDSQHSAWRDSHGLIYRRRLFMRGKGTHISGEDSLFRPVSAGEAEDRTPIPYDVRFHLHPSVKILEDGPHLKLVLPSGASWHFITDHAQKGFDRSVYLGRGIVEKCWQIVLSSEADPNGDENNPANIVKWELAKLD